MAWRCNMGTIADKLEYTAQAREEIRAAIVAKGVNCPGTAPFCTFDDYITQISGGGTTMHSIPEIVNLKCFEVSGSTMLSCSIYASKGDRILATISVRSALILPDALTLLSTSEAFESNQTLSFAYCNVTETGMHTLDIQQASAGRIYVNLIVLRGDFEFKYTGDFYALYTSFISGNSPATPPSKKEGQMLIWGCSADLWSVAGPYGEWQVSPRDMLEVNLDEAYTAPRQANFVDFGSADLSHTFWPAPYTTGSTCCIDAVEIVMNSNT